MLPFAPLTFIVTFLLLALTPSLSLSQLVVPSLNALRTLCAWLFIAREKDTLCLWKGKQKKNKKKDQRVVVMNGTDTDSLAEMTLM